MYGPHGTEVLFLTYDETAKSVRAFKITGDENVPRGAQTWVFSMDDKLDPAELPSAHQFRDLPAARLFRGLGTICARGFITEERDTTTNFVAVTSKDEIIIHWGELDHTYFPRYVRYKGRDLASETQEHLLRRPLGWR